MQWLFDLFANWLAAFIGKFIAKEIKQVKDEKEIDKQAAAAAKEEQDAKTPEELDQADRDLLHKL